MSIPNISCRFNFESGYRNIGLHICLLQTHFLMYCVRSQALNDWEGNCVSNVSLAWHPLAPQVSAVIAGLAAVLTAAQTYSFLAQWWTVSLKKVRRCPTLVYLSVVCLSPSSSPMSLFCCRVWGLGWVQRGGWYRAGSVGSRGRTWAWPECTAS